jgi:ATP-binding protein involved in chromosome partitioning
MDRASKGIEAKHLDPRLTAIDKRLSGAKRIIVVVSGKGGVGKSLIASTLSLFLSKEGKKTGLLDIDFHGPSCHVILNAGKEIAPSEEKGLIPPKIWGIKFMSLVYFSKHQPLPIRGKEISDALIELLTITKWGKLDYLIVDAPPGMGEEILDIIRFIKRGEFLIVATPSLLTIETVARLTRLLLEVNAPILGMIENMCLRKTDLVESLAEKFGVKYLGRIGFDDKLENSIKDPEKLLKTNFAHDMKNIVKNFSNDPKITRAKVKSKSIRL